MAKTSAPFGHPFGRPRHWIASGRMASAMHTNNSSRDDQMNEFDSEVAHSGNRINSSKNHRTRANLTTRRANGPVRTFLGRYTLFLRPVFRFLFRHFPVLQPFWIFSGLDFSRFTHFFRYGFRSRILRIYVRKGCRAAMDGSIGINEQRWAFRFRI
jgi:hypothetical protein